MWTGRAEPVGCPERHGTDHQRLRLPTPRECGGCHEKQQGEFEDEAHNDPEGVERGHAALARALGAIRASAAELRGLGEAEQARDGLRADPGELWLVGPYTIQP